MNTIIKESRVCLLLLLVAGLALTGCASRNASVSDSMAEYDRESMSPADRFRHDYRSPAMARMQDELPFSKSLLIKAAKTALGTPYVPGGTSQAGFDCSGFVQWAFKHVGVALPRTAREQSLVGEAIREEKDMVAGDIVAFRHPRRGYHTGIYVGDGKFIHSPRKRKAVQINSLDDPYFSNTFLGARRVTVSSDADVEAAQRLVAQYESRQTRKNIRADVSPRTKADFSTKRSSKEKVSASSKGKSSSKNKKVTSKQKKSNAAEVKKSKSSAQSKAKTVASASSSKKGNAVKSKSSSSEKKSSSTKSSSSKRRP